MVGTIQINDIDFTKYECIKDKYNRVVDGISHGRAIYYDSNNNRWWAEGARLSGMFGYLPELVANRLIGPGSRGPITKKLQETFVLVVSGQSNQYDKWLSYVNE